MLNLARDIQSLTVFKRKTSELVRQMKKTGRPVVLTVNGKAQLVVQDAKSYQRLLELRDRAEAIEGIRKGLESFRQGKGRLAREALEELRRKHGIPR